MKQRLSFFFRLLVLTFPLSVLAQTTQDSVKELSAKVDILAEELERIKLGEAGGTSVSATSTGNEGLASSKVYSLKRSGVSIAGYGEVVYQNFGFLNEKGDTAKLKDNAEFLRNVLYLGYRFDDLVLFNSEIEFEHGNEIYVEFGYIDLLLSKNFNIRGGLVLPAIGILNEKHEPTTFLSALRSRVENTIVPSTWRGIGGGFWGEIIGDLHYKLFMLEGLTAANNGRGAVGFENSNGIRNGRQKGLRATVEDWGFNGALSYRGVEGLNLGADFYVGNSGQGIIDSMGVAIDANVTLFTGHVEYYNSGLEARALYAMSSIDDAARLSGYLNKERKVTNTAIGSKQDGMYFSVGYDVLQHLISSGSQQALSPFIQYEKYNTQAEVPEGFTASPSNDRSHLIFGLRYMPNNNVAIKFDYNINKNKAETGVNQWNVVVGYMF